MAQVKAANATTTTSTTTTASPIKDTPSNGSDSSICSTMPPVTNVTLCEGVEDKNPEMHEHSSLHEEEEETEENIEDTVGCGITSVVSEEVTSSASSTAPVTSSTGTGGGAPSLILPETDNLSVSSPDSGHGTTSSQSDGQSEHDVVVSQHQPAHHHNHHHQHLLPHHHHHHPMMVGPDGTSGMMTAVLTEPGGPMLPHPMHHHHHYATWMGNGQAHHHPHHRVMEPVAINPETGFTTVLVDASAMAGYPHHHHLSTGVATGAPWPPHHHPYAAHPHHHPHAIPTGHHSHFGSQQQPQPPPHFLHPHAYHHHQTYDGGGGLGPADYGIAYMGGGSGAYDPGPLLSASTYHHDPTGGMYHDPTGALQHMSGVNNGSCPTSSASQYGTMNKNGGLAGRNNRSARGASVSPKRPTNRSASQNNSSRSTNGQRQQRSSGGQSTVTTSGGGRFTPSPSSGRSRGSSPGQPPLIPSSQASCNNSVGAVPAGPLPPNAPGQHVVHLHVNPGETVSLQMGGQVQVIQGNILQNGVICESYFKISLFCVDCYIYIFFRSKFVTLFWYHIIGFHARHPIVINIPYSVWVGLNQSIARASHSPQLFSLK